MKTFNDQLITALAEKIEIIIKKDEEIANLQRDLQETQERSRHFFEKNISQENEIERLKEKIEELETDEIAEEE